MRKEYVGQNEDGTPRYHFIAEDGEIAVLTNGVHIVGVHTMEDGTMYDVNDVYTAVAPEHYDELHHAIAKAVGENPDHPYEYDEKALTAELKGHRKVLPALEAHHKAKGSS